MTDQTLPADAPAAAENPFDDARPATPDAGARAGAGAADEKPPLIPRGNPLRLARGGVTAGLGVFFTYLLAGANGQIPFAGVPAGIVCTAVAAWGLMDLLGSFDDAPERVAASTTLADLARPLGGAFASMVAFALSLVGAASGLFHQWVWGVIVTLAFIGFVVAVFDVGVKLGPWAKDELGLTRPLWQRHGFWVVVASSVLLLPCLGSFSLWDPWETHYGEVAREILARDDWISTWWAQDGFFYSKPVLDFWIQAIFMATLGVHYQPGKMLDGVAGAAAHPEWVVRTPVFLLAVVAIYVLYKGVAGVFGRRAGLLGALVLATMPDWWFLAHQTMTDMPFVGPTATAMGLILIGLYTPEDQLAKVYEVKAGKTTWRLSAWHLVFGAVLVVVLPQIIYLFSRNFEVMIHGSGPYGFRPHWDEFRTGSGMGNCGLPGNEGCHTTQPAGVPANLRGENLTLLQGLERVVVGFEPASQALVWTAVLALLLWLNWGERRVRRLAYLGGWFFAGLATSAKGPAGFALPILCGLAYVATTKQWSELVRFELVSGLFCIVALVAFPWWVAMYVRHGSQFSDELIFHDLVNRAFSHVHDTNEGDDTSFRFYIWQLGYALFPWTGLAPLGLVFGLRRAESQQAAAGGGGTGRGVNGRGEASILLMMWFVFAFALFSFMGTKFHHYIFPAVPPAGMLIGIALDDMLGPSPLFAAKKDDTTPWAIPRAAVLYGGLLAVAAGIGVVGVAKAFGGSIWGDRLTGDGAGPSYVLSAVFSAVAVAAFIVLVRRYTRPEAAADATAKAPRAPEDIHLQLMFSAAAIAGALIVGVVARDLVIKPDNSSQPGAARLLQLFTYRYDRGWPESLDFSSVLAGFGFVAVALGLALSVRRVRTQIILAFLAFAMLWTVWGADVYMVKVAPHWGQREILAAYYKDRSSPNDPIVAYQMNWKGENFYSSNEIPAFVSSGGAFTTWVKGEREKGVKTIYFVTEHGRVGGLKGEVQGKSYREITDKTVNNKFVLVRAEL
jgi:4-amino-4-deoxy-L-arabinose transferase-like glycosyltransferase